MSRTMGIHGKGGLRGEVRLPGDKSISHRVAMLAAIAQGVSRISNFASSADCHATLECVRRLGIEVEFSHDEVIIHGQGLRGMNPPRLPAELDAQNSGSTIRMISGILAGQRFTSTIDGDASLHRRPMQRIIEPLTLMGAQIGASDGNFAPLTIIGGELRAIDYTSPVASAQVKTCVLFAGLYADGRTRLREPSLSRNHSELMLAEFGARLEREEDGTLSIEGGAELNPVDYSVPGDVSSAAFVVGGASVLAGSEISMKGVSLNRTRTGFFDVLDQLGAQVEARNVRAEHGELVGDLYVTASQLKTASGGLLLAGDIIPNIIDEIPMLAVLATQVEGRVEVRGARELRIKESDRIRTVVAGIRAMGGVIDEYEDGFAVSGPQALVGARVETEGDHRIAMAFAVAGLMADGRTEIVDADCAAVSFPEFYDILSSLAGEGRVTHQIEP
ncbi:MAG: 3-phosphoshikimate 1-carboxyvinyltransferase [Blastocatellia bacterium]